LNPRRTSQWRGHRGWPHGARGSGPKGGESFLILAARWLSAEARRRRSGRCHRRCLLPSSLRATGSPFPWSAVATKSRSPPDSSCGSRGSSGCSCKGLQGLLVTAPF
jgi:hypothetical protein